MWKIYIWWFLHSSLAVLDVEDGVNPLILDFSKMAVLDLQPDFELFIFFRTRPLFCLIKILDTL